MEGESVIIELLTQSSTKRVRSKVSIYYKQSRVCEIENYNTSIDVQNTHNVKAILSWPKRWLPVERRKIM